MSFLRLVFILIFATYFYSCSANTFKDSIIVGASDTTKYFSILKNKKIALLINQTSMVNNRLLPDFLIDNKLEVCKIFSPEHGLKTNADAGEKVNNEVYIYQNKSIPVVSLYGDKKQPSSKDLDSVDIVVFDIQDVGARFYTYLSTMYYLMQTCADNNKTLVVLDRPNPNGNYVDGPVLKDEKLKSFVGIIPIPIVHGCTLGELALMINKEKWLKGDKECLLIVVSNKNYSHKLFYEPPIPPSPNLNTMESILLYPSLCWFEGSICSVGRGTDFPFRVYGFPNFKNGDFMFVPKSKSGATNPMYLNDTCFGKDLRVLDKFELFNQKKINLFYLKDAYNSCPKKENFFNNFFFKLAGTEELKQQIIDNVDEKTIRGSWQKDLNEYLKIREKYLLYEDF
jgi:uncharacterized protein YbbC (DUF1343 family)